MLQPLFRAQALPFGLPRFVRLTALLVGLLGVLPGCSDDADDEPPTPVAGPNRISVPKAGVFPEGIQYDEAGKRYFVSSRTTGIIGVVGDDSVYTEFGRDIPAISGNRLISTIGINLDAPRQRLLAAVSDNGFNPNFVNQPTRGKLAALAIFNSSNGTLTKFVDLGALRPALMHFANDIAVDRDGNIYITDSMSPIIYKVDRDGNNPSVFLEDPRLGGTGFGLNGIVYHPDGYLLAVKTNDGTLFKVPIATPSSFTAVTSSQSLVGADGMLLYDPQTLLVVSGGQRTVFRMRSTDNWGTTSANGSFATGPATGPSVGATTITRRADDAYVLYPYGAASPRFAFVKALF
jgi:sugar lactone lactonase YvrE